ncbi:MAG: T9SS type A sorting domain-containing protein [Bacteroidetes bacterium]|nr:T9SS type A sorting domain-containing protein [Bacteroidota bacterium]
MQKIKLSLNRMLLIFLAFGMSNFNVFAERNAPVTTFATKSACPAHTAMMPVTVTGFTNIAAVSLRIDYDPRVASFNSAVPNMNLSSMIVNSVNISSTQAKLLIVWSDVTPRSLAATDTLVKITMNYISGSTTFVFNNTSGGGGDCEYVDETYTAMNDIPTATYYINGSIDILTIGTPGPVTGSSIVCAGASGVAYSIAPVTNATAYTWSLPSGFSITNGLNTNLITANAAGTAVSGNITVTPANACGSGSSSPNFAVTVNPMPVPATTGAASVCIGASGLTYSTESGMTGYTWSVSSGGTITAGAGTNTIIVTWNTAGAQTVSVSYTNANNCTAVTPTVKNVTVNPLPVPAITGSTSVCTGATGITYSTESGMTGYTWSVSSGGTITAGTGTSQITVSWNTNGAQTVSVNYTNTNSCTASAATVKNVMVNPLPVPTITGSSTVCAGSTGITYSTESGMTAYVWSVSSGGAITPGSGTDQITVSWNNPGAQTVSANYTNANGCTATTATVKDITVNNLPEPTLTGPSAICAGTAGNIYTTQSGMSDYAWTVSAGGTITSGGTSNSSSVTVTWNTIGAQTVSVNYANANGCYAINPYIFNVTVNPLPVPVVSGPAAACTGSSGNIYSASTGMSDYLWTVSPGGTITSGGTSGSSSATVSWNTSGAQFVSLNYTNDNGCTALSPVSYDVTVSASPVASISGPDSVCQTTPGTYSTEGGMLNYIWTVSSGGTIISGQGTSSVHVQWNDAGAQTLSVIYSGAGGCSPLNPAVLDVTVIPKPAIPVVTVNGDTLISNALNGNQWYFSLSGNQGNPVAGATGQSHIALETGYYWTIVTLTGCSSDTSNHEYMIGVGISENNNNPGELSVYPVPNGGVFTISLQTMKSGKTDIQVINELGLSVYLEQNIPLTGYLSKTIDLRPLSTGVYTVILSNSEGKTTRRIIIR